jgi:hypothetical protein
LKALPKYLRANPLLVMPSAAADRDIATAYVVAVANEDSDSDRSHPKAFVNDSAITTKIKTQLAAEHITSLGPIHGDTAQALRAAIDRLAPALR